MRVKRPSKTQILLLTLVSMAALLLVFFHWWVASHLAETVQILATVSTAALAVAAYYQIAYISRGRSRRIALDALQSAACLYREIVFSLPVSYNPKFMGVTGSMCCYSGLEVIREDFDLPTNEFKNMKDLKKKVEEFLDTLERIMEALMKNTKYH